jgi:hypothetical protein
VSCKALQQQGCEFVEWWGKLWKKDTNILWILSHLTLWNGANTEQKHNTQLAVTLSSSVWTQSLI